MQQMIRRVAFAMILLLTVVIFQAGAENERVTFSKDVAPILGLKVKDGLVVGKFDDAKDSVQPPILQTLPNTFRMPANTSTDD